MGEGKVFCVAGIDTDIGKTVVTGLIGRFLQDSGVSVITQKVSQTGCVGVSEDILQHRKIMGIELQNVDKDGTTCPYVFPEPCSPHLAAALTGISIDTALVTGATDRLKNTYDIVLLEGVGGLLVPLNEDDTLLDYLEFLNYPIILVSSSTLGSINHTLSALELAKNRGIEIKCIIYNRYAENNSVIGEDSARIFSRYLVKHGFEDRVIDVYDIRRYEAGARIQGLDFLLG